MVEQPLRGSGRNESISFAMGEFAPGEQPWNSSLSALDPRSPLGQRREHGPDPGGSGSGALSVIRYVGRDGLSNYELFGQEWILSGHVEDASFSLDQLALGGHIS